MTTEDLDESWHDKAVDSSDSWGYLEAVVDVKELMIKELEKELTTHQKSLHITDVIEIIKNLKP